MGLYGHLASFPVWDEPFSGQFGRLGDATQRS